METLEDLPNDVAQLKAIIGVMKARNEHLETLIRAIRDAAFGRKSEKLSEDQFQLALEDLEVGIAKIETEKEADQVTPSASPRKPRSVNRGSLPKHLLRVEEAIEPKSTICSCGCQMHVIGEDVSERLDVIPAQFRVIVTRRPKYGCRGCESAIVQAPAPARLIPGGIPTEATVAHVLTAKFADHCPLYRQAQIYSRQGIELDRSTLTDWVGRAAFELRPVFNCLLADLKRSTKLFMDETRAPVLDPGRKRTKTGYLWALARDDRAWSGPDPPGVAYCYAPSRSGEHAEAFLEGFSGILQVDGYAGYNRLARSDRQGGAIELAYCWAHARRKLYEIAKGKTAPIAEEGLKQIARIYRIEEQIRGRAADERLTARREHVVPLVNAFGDWVEDHRAKVSAKSPMGAALRYIFKLWNGLSLFLEDGRIEVDSNNIERIIRPLALNRKNALFAGHDEGGRNWGVIASLIETAKLNKIDPQAYLARTLTAIVQGHKQSRIEELLPWNYAA